MKKSLSLSLFVAAFVVILGTAISCKSTTVLPPITIEKTNTITKTETIRDTVFQIEKDSSSLKALLECQNGKVVVKSILKQEKGKYLQPPKIDVKDNILKIDCNAEAQKLFAKWKETYIRDHQQTVTTKPVKVKRPLTLWQKTQIWSGRIFFLLLVIVIIGFLDYKGLIKV